MAAMKYPIEIYLYRGVPHRRFHLDERLDRHCVGATVSSVVDEDVHLPHSTHCVHDTRKLRDVEGEWDCGPSRGSDPACDGHSSLCNDVVHEDGCAMGCQRVGDPRTDVLTSARHQGDAPLEIEHPTAHDVPVELATRSGVGSRGRPRTRSEMMLRWIWSVPPPMRMDHWDRKCCCQKPLSGAASLPSIPAAPSKPSNRSVRCRNVFGERKLHH